MLTKFRQAKQAEIADLKQNPLAPESYAPIKRANFGAAIRLPDKIAVIAEYKRASPSKGLIRSDLNVEDVAVQYEQAGAAAISILTEQTYFDGNLDYLAVASKVCSRPLLRKDFIFDICQIDATARTPAAALLLITRLYQSPAELGRLIERAESYGMDAVVEIFDANDLAMARDAGASIIQINSRDLQSLKVDRRASLELIAQAKPQKHETWIAASGIDKPVHLKEAREAGFNAVLVGGALMASGQPGANLEALLRGAGQ